MPPLCVVGIALRQGQIDAAGGALLLFVTNYLAILLAGGITLWLLGLWRAAPGRSMAYVRRMGLIVFFAGIVLVAIPLTITAAESISRTIQTNAASADVTEWLAGRNYQLVSVSLIDRLVVATIEGSGDLSPIQELANQLAQTLDRPVLVNVRTVPAQHSESGGP